MVIGNTLSANLFDYTQQNSTVASRVFGTNYQNLTGRAMFVIVTSSYSVPLSSSILMTALTDTAAAPTTIIDEVYRSQPAASTTLTGYESVHMIVLPGNYYKVTSAVTGTGANTKRTWIEYT